MKIRLRKGLDLDETRFAGFVVHRAGNDWTKRYARPVRKKATEWTFDAKGRFTPTLHFSEIENV